jgi:uncharacterized protein involved in outer membrane biogenesis
MIKWLFKWLFRLAALAVVLVVIFLLTYNALLRSVVEHNIRAQTGMDAEIGKFSLSLVSPTLEIQNQKIYNPPSFGGTPFLDIPEIHVEYDRLALARKEIHITLLRFNLGELDIVKNQAGQTNIFALGVIVPSKKPGGSAVAVNLKKQTGYDFQGIDVLNVSIGKVRFIDLSDARNNREQPIGIENCVLKNVKSPADLAGLGLLIGLRGGDFFTSLAGQKNSGFDILKLLGQ